MAQTDRHREVIRYANVSLDVIAEGQGPLIVLLPSRGRDSEDYDEVAAGIARAGFRVLRPQPRGVAGSTGPMDGITLHDLANDVAAVIEQEGHGAPAVVVGHAYGNWVARMTAVDHPKLVRGVIIAAAAAKHYPPELSAAVGKSGDPSLPDEERLQYLRYAFFAPGHDARIWLAGWWPEANRSQDRAAKATKQSEWWSAGSAPLFDLQAELDPFKPQASRNELKDEFGDRVTIAVIPGASHALIPEQPHAVVEAIVGWVRKLP
ncbi:MAG TPA: alpha/beta hydrolase [Alphaproteobacteria bacterium]|nr:alpha/beta hydrolase [Alphaproteobacteria bacterium]